jgi:uncharacterized iron-regulated protein
MTPERLFLKDTSRFYEKGVIISSIKKDIVSFEEMMADLSGVEIVYLGEIHTNRDHHTIQLKIIKALMKNHKDLQVGMEMFDVTYQAVLDKWSAGDLDETAFLEKTHWYAEWNFDYSLYRDLMEFFKEKKIKIRALNIPSYIPPRIAVGGIGNLSENDKKLLPEAIDTGINDHREYLEKIFEHHHIRGQRKFEYFYAAQCVWEEVMADNTANSAKNGMMVILAGNGHIVRKYGIPDRTFKRNGKPFRTVLPTPVGSRAEFAYADYIWVTPDPVLE